MCGTTDISDWCYYESSGKIDYDAAVAGGMVTPEYFQKMMV
jgi:hypothetical protein